MNQYLGTRPIMESCLIEIPNARQCRFDHGLPPYENRGIEKVILKNRKMKFCNKCHKMIVKKINNPNNLYRICSCDTSELEVISEDVKSRMRSITLGTTTKSSNGRSFSRAMKEVDRKL